jgi:hypothetical protein
VARVTSRDYHPESVLKTWRDDSAGKLEMKLTEIAVEVVLTAETEYRQGAIRQHEWRINERRSLRRNKGNGRSKPNVQSERAASG